MFIFVVKPNFDTEHQKQNKTKQRQNIELTRYPVSRGVLDTGLLVSLNIYLGQKPHVQLIHKHTYARIKSFIAQKTATEPIPFLFIREESCLN